MSIFNFDTMSAFGRVQSVDTATITIQVEDASQLSRLQVNHLIAIRSSKVGQALIGMVSKIMRKFSEESDSLDEIGIVSTDIVKAVLIGTLLDREGERRDVFKRTLESVPEIDSQCFIMAGDVLTSFMGAVSGADSEWSTRYVLANTQSMMVRRRGWMETNCSNVMRLSLEALVPENPSL